jgi:hypothetical protein
VQQGDKIFMLSDGVLPPGEDPAGIMEFIKNKEVSPKSLIAASRRLYADLPPDDMTVVIISIEKL